MNDGSGRSQEADRFLTQRKRYPRRHCRWMMISMLLIWDGVLLYMIAGCLIEPVYGAAFVAMISITLGYQL